MIAEADAAGFQLAVHAIGDRANSLVLDAFEKAARANGPRDRRFRIEHAQVVRKQDLPRYKALGVIASIQPSHCIDDMRWAEKRIGRGARARRLQLPLVHRRGHPGRLRHRLVRRAARPAPRPLRRRHPRASRPGGPPGAGSRRRRSRSRRPSTSTRAAPPTRSSRRADKGTLERGRLADLVVFAADLFGVAPREILTTPVDLTVVGRPRRVQRERRPAVTPEREAALRALEERLGHRFARPRAARPRAHPHEPRPRGAGATAPATTRRWSSWATPCSASWWRTCSTAATPTGHEGGKSKLRARARVRAQPGRPRRGGWACPTCCGWAAARRRRAGRPSRRCGRTPTRPWSPRSTSTAGSRPRRGSCAEFARSPRRRRGGRSGRRPEERAAGSAAGARRGRCPTTSSSPRKAPTIASASACSAGSRARSRARAWATRRRKRSRTRRAAPWKPSAVEAPVGRWRDGQCHRPLGVGPPPGGDRRPPHPRRRRAAGGRGHGRGTGSLRAAAGRARRLHRDDVAAVRRAQEMAAGRDPRRAVPFPRLRRGLRGVRAPGDAGRADHADDRPVGPARRRAGGAPGRDRAPLPGAQDPHRGAFR